MTTKQGLSSIKIQGKDYVLVNDRVKYFRENFKGFTLQTSWLKCDEKIAICKAIVKNPEGKIYATGTAFEVAGSSFINKTSHIENAETSAVGRALGFCNIGIDVSIASAEEVLNATRKPVGKPEVKQPKPANTDVAFIKAKKILGDKFYEILGTEGYEDYKEVPKDKVASVLAKMRAAVK